MALSASMGGSLRPIDNPIPPTLDGVVTFTLLVSEDHADEGDGESESDGDAGEGGARARATMRVGVTARPS